MKYYILAINPASTSTKIAVYENDKELFRSVVNHPEQEIAFFENFYDQVDFRREVILNSLSKKNFDIKKLSAIVGRGGMLPPVSVGGYEVNDKMIDFLMNSRETPHVSNFGCMLARQIAKPLGIPAYIYDAISACSLPPEAVVTGFSEIKRVSSCHVLNSRAAAIKYAQSMGKNYNDINVTVANLGVGISVSAHVKGKIVEVVGDDNGCFSPERSGAVPIIPLINLCYNKKFSRREMLKKVRGNGGIKSHLGTTDLNEVESMVANGDEKAKLIYDAQVLQIAKAIGIVSAAVKGNVEAVILTGDMTFSEMLISKVKEYVSFIAPLKVFPGENKLEALALGGLRIIRGEETVHEFDL